jgi:hypothetical protein
MIANNESLAMRLLVDGTCRLVAEAGGSPYLGHLFSPASGTAAAWVASTGLPWAADNGCFLGLDRDAFLRLLDRIEGLAGGLFVVAPDVVGEARATYDLFAAWQPIIAERGHPIAYVAQNGQEDFPPPWHLFEALFIGGTADATGHEWKEGPHAARLIRQAKSLGKHVHMGRVNTLRRFKIAYHAGCDSIDGSKHSKFPDTWIPISLRWLEQIHRRPPRGWHGLARQEVMFQS